MTELVVTISAAASVSLAGWALYLLRERETAVKSLSLMAAAAAISLLATLIVVPTDPATKITAVLLTALLAVPGSWLYFYGGSYLAAYRLGLGRLCWSAVLLMLSLVILNFPDLFVQGARGEAAGLFAVRLPILVAAVLVAVTIVSAGGGIIAIGSLRVKALAKYLPAPLSGIPLLILALALVLVSVISSVIFLLSPSPLTITPVYLTVALLALIATIYRKRERTPLYVAAEMSGLAFASAMLMLAISQYLPLTICAIVFGLMFGEYLHLRHYFVLLRAGYGVQKLHRLVLARPVFRMRALRRSLRRRSMVKGARSGDKVAQNTDESVDKLDESVNNQSGDGGTGAGDAEHAVDKPDGAGGEVAGESESVVDAETISQPAEDAAPAEGATTVEGTAPAEGAIEGEHGAGVAAIAESMALAAPGDAATGDAASDKPSAADEPSAVSSAAGADADQEPHADAAPTFVPSNSLSTSQLADALRAARRVMVVPGYGALSAGALTSLAELFAALGSRQVLVVAHPLAGRYAGHAQEAMVAAGISLEEGIRGDDVFFWAANSAADTANSADAADAAADTAEHPRKFAADTADIVLVVGANDIVNPAVIRSGELEWHQSLRVARQVVVIARSFAGGFSRRPNLFFRRDNVHLLAGDAATVLHDTATLMTTQNSERVHEASD